MNVILISFACNPTKGSECICGWNTALSYANKGHHVFVVTAPWHKKDIKETKNVSFFYYDFKNIFSKVDVRKNTIMYFMYYKHWIKSVHKIANEIIKKQKIDFVQHITLGDFRFIEKVKKINAPFIFGPVGGGQKTPKIFWKYLAKHKVNEYFRKIMNFFTIYNLLYQRNVKKSILVYACNEETKSLISKIKGTKVKIMTENGTYDTNDEDFNLYKDFSLMRAGRMIYRKGLYLLVDIIKRFAEKYPSDRVIFNLYGEGPLKNELMKLTSENELPIKFHNPFVLSQKDSVYKSNQLFIFPSIRETTGTVLFEAISYGLPILCNDYFGAKFLLKDNSKYQLVSGRTLNEVIDKYCDYIHLFYSQSSIMKEVKKANFSIKKKFLWDNKADLFIQDFEDLTHEINN